MKNLTYGPIELAPVAGFLGAEVPSGAHIGTLDPEVFVHLRQAWLDWKVLFFSQPARGDDTGSHRLHPTIWGSRNSPIPSG